MVSDNMHYVSDHPITRRVNSTNAKKIAVVLTIALIIYHGILHLSYGIKSCKWLLSDGSFHGFGSYRVWQPYGCMFHTYNKVLVFIFIYINN
jgi:hypothetical protein